MRAISLIYFVIYFYDDTNSDVVANAIQVYSQGWCSLDVVDNSHPKGKLVNLAVDQEFDTNENNWKSFLHG